MPHTRDRVGDRGGAQFSRTVLAAEVLFWVLGFVQFLVALWFHRSALAVDGLHNVGDGLWLELVRRMHRAARQGGGGRFWTCRVEPLLPAVGALLAIGGSLLLWRWGVAVSSSERGAALAFGLEVPSVVMNFTFALKLHELHEHGDSHSTLAIFHLVGDLVASMFAALTYVLILMGADPKATDLLGGKAVFGTIVLAHAWPVARSIVDFVRHIGPHEHHRHSHDYERR